MTYFTGLLDQVFDMCSKGMQVECLTRMLSQVVDRDVSLSVLQDAG